jgi:hypothetical protein
MPSNNLTLTGYCLIGGANKPGAAGWHGYYQQLAHCTSQTDKTVLKIENTRNNR